MPMRRLAAAATALVALLATAPARAKGRADFPQELTQRPLTLPQGMTEVWLPVNVGLDEGAAGEPVFLNPALYFGVTDRFTLGVRHLLGVCLGGGDGGCPQVYNDVSLEGLVGLLQAQGVELGAGLALNVAPLGSDAAWSGEVKLVGSVEAGPVSISLAPELNFGLNERERVQKRSAIGFEGSVYNLVLPQEGEDNREELSVPLTVQVQLLPALTALAGASLEGPLDPPGSSFGDEYSIAVMGGLVATPLPRLDIGAALTFPRLLGQENSADARTLSLFGGLRF